MTLANLKRQHAHLKWLASGEFTERDFDYKIARSENPEGGSKFQGEGGWSSMGEMKPQRKQLIQQDAIRTLEVFESKVRKTFPELFDSPKVNPLPVEKPQKPKPKGKN